MLDGPLLEPSQALRDLEALEAISESPSISQRDLAKRLGIALGLTNACLKRMANAGLIKISRVNQRSLAYHLTPAGFAAKTRLSLEYARTTVDFYRSAKEAVRDNLSELADQSVTTIGLLGATDLGEIVGIVALHIGLDIVWVADVDTESRGSIFLGHEVEGVDAVDVDSCDAVIVAYLEDTDFWIQHVSNRTASGTVVRYALHDTGKRSK